MEKSKKSHFFALICAMFLTGIFIANPLAVVAGSVNVSQVSPITSNSSNIQTDVDNAVGLPPVSMDEMTDLVESKAYDVVHLLQVFFKPFAVIVFIGSAIMSLLGIFGKSGAVMKGVVGMAIAGFIYTAVMYAPQLVEFFSTWLLT